MVQTARLRLIRDRFIAGHSSCELHRYLDSVPLETPIRDVVYRCRVWESDADPEIRRVSSPGAEPIYPAYVVSDSDKVVVAVTKPKSSRIRWKICSDSCLRMWSCPSSGSGGREVVTASSVDAENGD